ncbi:MAG TPA: hypothetical protein VH370_01765 [Humisphaera sp.]|jgi:hypothetical protein|nr:hypothetical protein [Humisphaera sp.]
MPPPTLGWSQSEIEAQQIQIDIAGGICLGKLNVGLARLAVHWLNYTPWIGNV